MRRLFGIALIVLGVSGIASGLLALSGGGSNAFGGYDLFIGVGLLAGGLQLLRDSKSRTTGVAPGHRSSATNDREAEFEAHDGYWRDLGAIWITPHGDSTRNFPTLQDAQEAYLTMGYAIVGQSRPFDRNARPTSRDGRITLTFAPILPSMMQ